jgi:hypothetical protein
MDTIAHPFHKPKFIYTYQTRMNILNIFKYHARAGMSKYEYPITTLVSSWYHGKNP